MDAREGLRCTFAKIIADFDQKLGCFANLNYTSPLDLVTPEWAARSGYSLPVLRDAIIEARICRAAKVSLSESAAQIVNDLREAVLKWRKETGYQEVPIHTSAEDRRFRNLNEMEAYIEAIAPSLMLDDWVIEKSPGHLELFGSFRDTFDHKVSVGLAVKLTYGGDIWLDFRFPYYDVGEPSFFDDKTLVAQRFWNEIGIPFKSSPEWRVSKSKVEFSEIGTILSIVGCIVSYLKAGAGQAK